MSTALGALMGETMSKLKEMIDVNTIIGDAIETKDGTTIIPVSKVACGFGGGGSEFCAKQANKKNDDAMFGGGYGGGVSVNPMAFLVVKNDNIRLIPVSDSLSTVDRIVDMIPDALAKFNMFIKEVRSDKSKKEE